MSLLIAPIEALTDTRLGDQERRVLLALYSFRGKNTNTVWPSLDSLAARALIKDKPRISKITKSLEKKGWLTKKKRGFTGGNQYTLSVPDCVEISDTNLSNGANLEEPANLASDTKLEPDTNTNLAKYTNTNLASDTKCKEQTIEQTNEQGRAKRFIPPTLEEVAAYCQERGNNIDPESFIDTHVASGWKLSNGNPVKDWKAVVRTWERKRREWGSTGGSSQELID